MDDEAIGADQARRQRAALAAADLELGRVWMHYFRLGGDVSEMEIDAYLHHALTLPPVQRDLPAQAANNLIGQLPPPRAPYSCELTDPRPET